MIIGDLQDQRGILKVISNQMARLPGKGVLITDHQLLITVLYGLTTFPERIHLVQTRITFTFPSTNARTF